MKCVCTQENLSRGLLVVGHVASKNTTLPILSNILVRGDAAGILLSATNLEIGITKRIRGKVEREGVCAVPGRVFTEYVSLLEEGTVTMEEGGGDLVLRSEKGETKLHGLPAEDFPLIPHIPKENGYICGAKELREGISQVIFAAAYDDARPEISGVLLRFSEKNLVLVATDSYRLAEKHLKLDQGIHGSDASVIVPVRALQELLRILGQEGESVSVYLAENQILFVTNETELISRLIDGQYPNYEQILPVNHETRAVMTTDELVKAVRATSLFSRPGINDLTLSFTPPKTISLQAANNQIGENRQTVDADIDGAENTIVFNSRYLLDGLANLHREKAVFEMVNNANPGVFRPQGDDDYLYIIMPIKQ
ncbi:MAG: DNA polymerase III subunit beta [bacterium]